MQRREWLKGLCAVAMLGGCAGLPRKTASRDGFFAQRKLAIGIQLYTLAQAAAADLDGTFASLAGIGYGAVELAGLMGKSPAQVRASADRAGLKLTSFHIPAESRAPGDLSLASDAGSLAADLHMLGISRVAMPIFRIPKRLGVMQSGEGFLAFLTRIAPHLTADDWKRDAALLNEKGVALAREGIELGYHNHNPEFAPLGGATGFEILMRETDPSIFFEMDAGWVAAAGLSPIELLRRYPGRFRMMHVKDILPSTRPNFVLQQNPTEVGKGLIDWSVLLDAAFDAGVRDFFVEQEPPFTMDRLAALKISHDYLARL
ncbi:MULTISPECIES: sugar phosphate isomerase/epimerase family protein [Sphingobium]|nr:MULTISPECIES: sugar phosphate isomerase/epimerase [Sphingobium]MBJ7376651.1 sugar phosphate isomerase/epimerase [Sphingobium sp.]